MAVVALFTQAWSIRSGIVNWQTMVFTILCLSQLGHVLAIRSEQESLFKIGFLSNKYLLGAVLSTFFLQLATVYLPILNPIFKNGAFDVWRIDLYRRHVIHNIHSRRNRKFFKRRKKRK
jgi:Ca2+-transporting ATPase